MICTTVGPYYPLYHCRVARPIYSHTGPNPFSFNLHYLFKYALTYLSLIQLSLKVSPYLGLIIGIFLYLLSFSGSSRVVDERVVVPANSYIEWSIQMYPGQALRAGASAITDDPSEVIRGVLELLIMDEEDFAYYESGDYMKIRERYQELINTNSWDWLDVNIRWFGRVHVVLNNKIRVSDRNSSKEANVGISVHRPCGYLALPSVILVGISLFKSYRQFKKDFM